MFKTAAHPGQQCRGNLINGRVILGCTKGAGRTRHAVNNAGFLRMTIGGMSAPFKLASIVSIASTPPVDAPTSNT
jgi:hypothetical protein